MPPEAAPPFAPRVDGDEASTGAEAGAEAGAEWRELAVGFIPPRAVCRQFPDWRRAAEVGTPSFRALFFHPALSVRFLPWTKPSAAITAAAARTAVVAAGTDAEEVAIALEARVATGCAVAAAFTGVAAVAAVAGATVTTGAGAAPESTCASEGDAPGLLLKTAALKLLAVQPASLLHYEGFEANWG